LIDNKFDIIVARNYHTQNEEIEINTGSILIKNSDWTKNFLNNVYSQNQFSLDGWAEQRAMMYLLKIDTTIKDRFKFVDFRLFNSTYVSWDEYNYQQGDFVLHLAGCGNIERLYALKSIHNSDKKKWDLNYFKKDGNISQYRSLIHDVSPFQDINVSSWKPTNDPGGLDSELFKNVLLHAGGDAVNLIVEVGSWLGGSAITMARYLKSIDNTHTDILCIDNWCGSLAHWEIPGFKKIMQIKDGRPTIYEQFLKNLKFNQLDDYIIPFHINSVDGARFLCNKNVQSDIVFIDASHEEQDVYQDITFHWKHLKKSGIMMGDDFEPSYPGVVNAVRRFASENSLRIMSHHNEWILQKS
jgi:predicted O-methyltransferase YrrM